MANTEVQLAGRLFLQPREGDGLVLDDETLRAALDDRQPLTQAQWRALMDSPLTLRRLRALSRERVAANDAGWQESAGLRLAADSGEPLEALRTADGYWSLHFLPEGDGWLAVLKLDAAAPFAAGLYANEVTVEARIGDGVPVLGGRLDAGYEIEAPWPFAESPQERLQRAGGRFVVRLRF